MNEIIVGIDLGTTNSEIAVVRDGRVDVLRVSDSGCILPSIVGIADDGGLLVGEAARNQDVLHPERTVRSIKRQMGEDVRVTMGEHSYRPQEISAIILRRLKEIAETQLGQSVQKAVITVPAYFSDAQRQATREAGEIAGLTVSRIINEPTAAALAYESTHSGARNALVYDLGGGTFDVSVVRLEGDVVEVLSSHGNNRLGGDDFDQKLIEIALAHLGDEHGNAVQQAAEASPIAMARLKRSAEAAKIALSSAPYATLTEEYLLEYEGMPIHLTLEIERADYEEAIMPFVDETLAAVHIALTGANLTVSDIDEILLVGGATRTPLISNRLEVELGRQPRGEVDPDLCVAMGAAIQAGVIAGAATPSLLIDITPYTFGTSAIAELDGAPYPHCFIPLIRRNTPIPVSKSEVFYTSYDNQERVEVMVYQGEARDALENIEIGRFTMDGLRKAPRGNPILLTFSLDVNGILHTTAREKRSGLEVAITIDNAIARFDNEELDQARTRIQSLFAESDQTPGGLSDESDADSLDSRRLRVEARALIEKGRRLLPDTGSEDTIDLVDAIEALETALTEDDTEVSLAMDTLADLLYYLES